VIRNVIFDWSGTLVDDLPAVWQASNHCFVKAGIEPLALDRFRAEFELPFKGFYQRHIPHIDLAQLEVWFHEKFVEVQDCVAELPHARDFLEFCRGRQLRTFILSAVHPDHFDVQRRATGFGPYLGRQYVGVRDKTDQIHAILADNNLDRDETILVGDMQHDVKTARHGKIASVAVLTGYNSLPQLRKARPDLIVEHLGELKRILEQNEMRLHPPENRPAGPPKLPVATVGALIFDEAGRMLLLRTNKWSDLWGIPGGKIEWGESSEQALIREIKEETALDVTDVRFVMVQDAIHPPEFYRDAHFLLLNYTAIAPAGQTVKLNSEAQDFRWVNWEDARALDLNTPTQILIKAVADLI
jgi:phosphoglycolate phosphatase-like HAD superfamily hydrolase/ADP-ribose pyrophosphatase YjhB (NUDIX family)